MKRLPVLITALLLSLLASGAARAEGSPAQAETQPTSAEPASAPTEGGRHLLLPDISFIVQAKGKLTDDRKDSNKQKIQLAEAELGIQGCVYPNVMADAFVTGSSAEDAAFQVEEAYLTYLGLAKGLNLYVGQKHAAFGRTNLLHSHSWLYVNQPQAIRNLVAHESLIGQGAALNYLIPTQGNLFAQVEVGTWGGGGHHHEHESQIMIGPGANLTDRFGTARLWTSYPISENDEVELGGSWASGRSEEEHNVPERERVRLAGVDLTYRRFGQGSRRALFRGEQFWRKSTTASSREVAKGHYLFANYRWDRYNSLGLLYDWSEFPQDTTLHETALSVIYTRQFSEQYYVRFQATHGSRPNARHYNELWIQWVWGVGPHTHNLE